MNTAVPGSQSPGWIVVVPVKGTPGAKSRLGGDAAERAALAQAIALDTVAAVVAADGVARVIVVTSSDLAGELRSLGADVVPDPGGGLTAAIGQGLLAAGTDAPVAVLLGDLPGLQPPELSAALADAGDLERAMVPDADGVGTVLVTAGVGVAHRAAFGGASRVAHLEAGYNELVVSADSGLRRDVDTREQLAALGSRAGPRTAALTAKLLEST